MDVIRSRPVSAHARFFALASVTLGVAAATLCLAERAYGGIELRDAPVSWIEDDRGNIEKPKVRDPNLLRDGVDESFFRPLGRLLNPVRATRKVGTIFGADHVGPASNVNALDEVPSSTWFTNRIGLYPMTPEEVARGPVTAEGPDRSTHWTVVSAKSQGVTPGFQIKDGRGDRYLIKFDPPCCPGMSSAAGVITGRLLHAAGYNVPEDFVITLKREDLVLGEKVNLTEPNGKKRPMTVEDIDKMLARVTPRADGTWVALASKFLKGSPVGPTTWQGRRKDDPMDRVRHENRRELRGFRVFAAWLGHFDTKELNTLDMYVEEAGQKHLRHYMIDFASTLGAGATGPFPKANYEYAFDVPASLGRGVSLGIYQTPWERIERPPGLDEVGYLESKEFAPGKWKPLDPNASFANLTDRDGYWAAKIVSAFTRKQLEAVVAEGKYQNPEAAAYVVRMLEERRDKVARHWFEHVAPLDFFTLEGTRLRYHDLGAERGIYPGIASTYRSRVALVGPGGGDAEWSRWSEGAETVVELQGVLGADPANRKDALPFLAVETQVRRGGDWSSSVTVYLARASGRVIALER